MKSVGAWVLGLALTGCAAEGPQIRSLLPSLAVAPASLDFGEVGPPQSSTILLYLSNTGSADLDFSTVSLTGPPVFVLDPPEGALPGEEPDTWAFAIDPDSQVGLPVTFTPDSFRSYEATIVLESDDPDRPRVVVPVTGSGVDLPFPDIEISPGRTVDAVDVPIGGYELMAFDILNTGDADLMLLDVALEGDPEFVEQSLPDGAVIRPGDARTVLVAYAPNDKLGNNALVLIDSNDPDEGRTSVLLLGNGGGPDFEYPVAVIDCPGQVLLAGPEYVELDGSDSYDPAKLEPLTYEWTVVSRPDASDDEVPLDPDDTAIVDLYADVAGQYTVELVVRNAVQTASEPASCTFDAVPEDDIHVELSWDTSQADLDLHLVQGGANLFDEPEDCNFCNQTPDWGTASADDDPRLDIDDRGGFGPENINLFSPQTGTYDVLVHYYAPHGDGAVVASVKVWLYGVEQFSGSRVVEAVDDEWDVWSVGTISIPSGTFTVDGSANTTTTLRTCQN
jgi:hypothetical protein